LARRRWSLEDFVELVRLLAPRTKITIDMSRYYYHKHCLSPGIPSALLVLNEIAFSVGRSENSASAVPPSLGHQVEAAKGKKEGIDRKGQRRDPRTGRWKQEKWKERLGIDRKG
jgi:hypothetical protein